MVINKQTDERPATNVHDVWFQSSELQFVTVP